MPFMSLALLVFLQDAIKPERYYELRRQIFVELADLCSKTGDACARSRDYEAASMFHSFASTLDRTVDAYLEKHREDLKNVQVREPFRSAVPAGASRQAFNRFKQLERLAKEAKLADEASMISVLAMQAEQLPALLDGVRRLNDYRTLLKIPPVGVSQELSFACMLHCRYMALEDYGHDERKSSPYYDERGERAGQASVIAGGSSVAHTVDLHMSTFYHRIELIDPGTRAVGIGAWPDKKELLTAIDARRMKDEASEILVYPVHGQKNVPLEFAMGRGEFPDPLPKGRKDGGCPITLTCTGRYAPMIREDDQPEVVLEDANGDRIPIWISYPTRPANLKVKDNSLSVCAIPWVPLKKNAQYRATFTVRIDGKARQFVTVFTTENTKSR
jgi:hypothetical protein